MKDHFFFLAMPQLALQALSWSQWSLTPHGLGLSLHGLIFSLFLFPCIMKMRSSCEPCRSQMGLWVSLPLLTTNSLPGGGQFPLCCYNLFGCQVPHGIKNNLLSGRVWVVFAFRPGCSVSLCPLRGTFSGAEPFSWAEMLCAWEMETRGYVWAWKGLSQASYTFQERFSKCGLSTTMCQILCQDAMVRDRIPALVWIGKMHTSEQVNNGDNFRS